MFRGEFCDYCLNAIERPNDETACEYCDTPLHKDCKELHEEECMTNKEDW